MLMHRPQTPQPGFGSITLLQKFTPHFKILDPRLHQCRESAKWQMASTNVDVTTLPKRVSLRALDVNSHAG